MSKLLELHQVSKTYGTGESLVHALNDVNLTVNTGDTIAIMGASGSGKSTLLNIIGLLDAATSGEYIISDKSTADMSTSEKAEARNSVFGFVVQDFALIEKMTVFQNLEIPFSYRKFKLSASQKKTRINDLLEKMGIEDKTETLAQNLSGGQRQRVAISRALVNDQQIILADEPTGALDSKTTSEIMQILMDLSKDGKTVIVVTHNPNVAAYCDRILVMSDGRLSKGCKTENQEK